jgi:DNA-binding MarR family transcriptional regulator
MQQQEISAFLQSLRGSQALVVLAFLIVRQGMAVAELSAATGLNDDTVRTAIKALAKKGNLLRQRGAHGREVWIPAGQTLFALAGQNPKTSDSAAFQNPKTSDSGKILLSSSSVQADSLLLEEEEEEESPESENFGLCLRACDAVGIREPKRSKISRLPRVTPEFIRAHVEWGRAQGVPLGTVIYRIEHEWTPPTKYLGVSEDSIDPAKEAAAFTGHRVNCGCVDCSMVRSVNGATDILCPRCKHWQCTCDD